MRIFQFGCTFRKVGKRALASFHARFPVAGVVMENQETPVMADDILADQGA